MDERDRRADTELDDEQLLARLRELAGHADPVPEQLLASARSALEHRRPHAEVAVLTEDSAEDDTRPDASEDHAPTRRRLSFAAGELTIDLEVAPTPAGLHLSGQLTPRCPADIELRQPHSSQQTRADQHGSFGMQVRPGPMSIVCDRPGGPAVATAWVVVGR